MEVSGRIARLLAVWVCGMAIMYFFHSFGFSSIWGVVTALIVLVFIASIASKP